MTPKERELLLHLAYMVQRLWNTEHAHTNSGYRVYHVDGRSEELAHLIEAVEAQPYKATTQQEAP